MSLDVKSVTIFSKVIDLSNYYFVPNNCYSTPGEGEINLILNFFRKLI